MLLKTSLIQMASTDNKDQNIENAIKWVSQAINNGSKFILLPEMFNVRIKDQLITEFAEPIPGPSLTPFMMLAKTHHVWILAGSICEKIQNETKVFNTSVLIDPSGSIKACYRKTHLFKAKIKDKFIDESKHYYAGENLTLTKVNDIPVGLTLCYDLRFPEIFQNYAQNGTKIITVPSSFTKKTGQAHWEVLLRARAIETNCYILAPNQTGVGLNGIPTYGNSMIIDPWGTILAKASQDKEEIIYANLDLNYWKNCDIQFY